MAESTSVVTVAGTIITRAPPKQKADPPKLLPRLPPEDAPLLRDPPLMVGGLPECTFAGTVRTNFRHRLAEHLVKQGAEVSYDKGFVLIVSHHFIIYTINLGFIPYQTLMRMDEKSFVLLEPPKPAFIRLTHN